MDLREFHRGSQPCPESDDEATLGARDVGVEQPAATTWGHQDGDTVFGDEGKTVAVSAEQALKIYTAEPGAKIHVAIDGDQTTTYITPPGRPTAVYGYRAKVARSVSRRPAQRRQQGVRPRSREVRVRRAHAPPRRDDDPEPEPEPEPEPPERVAGFTLVRDLVASELSRLRW